MSKKKEKVIGIFGTSKDDMQHTLAQFLWFAESYDYKPVWAAFEFERVYETTPWDAGIHSVKGEKPSDEVLAYLNVAGMRSAYEYMQDQ